MPNIDIKDLESQLEPAVDLLKSIANERRLMIVCALFEGEKNVGELEHIVALSQSALSQHLARLRRDGIVATRREAQTIYYSLADDHVREVLQCLSTLYCSQDDDFVIRS